MKAIKKVLIGLAAAAILILAACSSPDDVKKAAIDESRMVFVEDDGSETPLVTEDGTGPEEIIDYVILDDGSSARSAYSAGRIRCVILGRHRGRPAVWVYFRYRGLTVIPNEEGFEEPELLALVEDEANPWMGDDWVYDALALSDDGRVIIGNLSRPEGWEFEDYLGEVPDPEIGIWWTLLEGEENYYVTRARPMILMEEPTPEDSVARCYGGMRYWWRLWRAYLIEWWQSHVLSEAWNYMAEVEAFADPADLDTIVPEGYYVATGTDKNGKAALAWFTMWSMNDITEAPDDPVEKTDPWPVDDTYMNLVASASRTFNLFVRDDDGSTFTVAQAVTDPALTLDPDGDDVYFRIRAKEGQENYEQAVSLLQDNLGWVNNDPQTGVLDLTWSSVYSGLNLFFEVWTDNDPDSIVPQTDPVTLRVLMISS